MSARSIQQQLRAFAPQFEGVGHDELGVDSQSNIAQAEYAVAKGFSVIGEMCSDDKIVNSRTGPDYVTRRVRLACQRLIYLLCEDKLIAGKFPRQRDLEMLEQDMQEVLPATWCIERETGGFYLLFKRRRTDPDFILNQYIFGGRAKLVSRVPVPGSVHIETGEKYRWRKGRAIDSELARLPANWVAMLPRVGGLRISGQPVTKPEFDASCVRSYEFDGDNNDYEFDA
jgi:hypothetical protein